MSNRARVSTGRKNIMEALAQRAAADLPPSLWSDEALTEHVDAFYAAWASEQLQQCIDRLMLDFHKEGKGDYFRVLHGKLCEGLTTKEVAELLSIKPTDVENFFKAAKKRLRATLEIQIQRHVEKYSPPDSVDDEFLHEWNELSAYLTRDGGLADAVRRCFQENIAGSTPARESAVYQKTLAALESKDGS
jgi:hypothetical protein